MDPTKEAIDIDLLLEKLSEYDTTVHNGGAISGACGFDYANISTISAQDTITLSSGLVNTTTIGGHANIPNISISSGTGTTYASPWATTATPWLGNGISSNPNGAGKLTLTGEGADVEINGISLSQAIKEIQERLNILTVNPEMEKEWDELRALGDQYRALEAKLKEQGEMWAKLKAMPPPPIL